MTASVATNNTSTDSAALRSLNDKVIETIRAHHRELARQLHEHTWALLAAAQLGDCSTARDTLHDWYRDELLPHVVAEENTLYSAAADVDATRLLILGMHAEHHTLVSLIADLALAQEPFETALAAASAQVLFTVHLNKENDLLLPALDAAELDLAALLDGMHEILGAAAGEPSDHSCGCGCGHGASDTEGASTLLQITDISAPQPAAEQKDVPAVGLGGELDVRTLPHGQRHEIIFGRLEALALGESLVIVNDHDPKPLRYQTEALWPERFTWTYLQAGPEIWRLEITCAH